jgi:hypothetical protein
VTYHFSLSVYATGKKEFRSDFALAPARREVSLLTLNITKPPKTCGNLRRTE